MSLIDRKINPPLFSLIDINEDQFACDIYIFILFCRSSAQIYHGKLLKAFCMKLCLVCSQLKFMLLSFTVFIAQHCMVEIPAVHADLILMHIRKPQTLHFLKQNIPGLKLCFGSGSPVSQYRIGFWFLHPLCQTVGIFCIDCFDQLLFPILPFIHFLLPHLLLACFVNALRKKGAAGASSCCT